MNTSKERGASLRSIRKGLPLRWHDFTFPKQSWVMLITITHGNASNQLQPSLHPAEKFLASSHVLGVTLVAHIMVSIQQVWCLLSDSWTWFPQNYKHATSTMPSLFNIQTTLGESGLKQSRLKEIIKERRITKKTYGQISVPNANLYSNIKQRRYYCVLKWMQWGESELVNSSIYAKTTIYDEQYDSECLCYFILEALIKPLI